MSDDEYDYEYDYGSDEGDSNIDEELVEIENSFYEGDDCKESDPKKAIELFQNVVKLEGERGENFQW